MKIKTKLFFTALLFIFIPIISCNNNMNNINKEKMLNKKWEYINYINSGFNIQTNKVDRYHISNDIENIRYSINIEEIFWNEDNKSGIIYGRYTIVPDYNKDAINKYYAISFKNLTSSSIKISAAYKKNGINETDTLDNAKTIFTVENGYFDFYSDCTEVK